MLKRLGIILAQEMNFNHQKLKAGMVPLIPSFHINTLLLIGKFYVDKTIQIGPQLWETNSEDTLVLKALHIMLNCHIIKGELGSKTKYMPHVSNIYDSWRIKS